MILGTEFYLNQIMGKCTKFGRKVSGEGAGIQWGRGGGGRMGGILKKKMLMPQTAYQN